MSSASLIENVIIAAVMVGALLVTVAGYPIFDHPLALGVYVGATCGVLSWRRRRGLVTRRR
jgi:hypothetical protein